MATRRIAALCIIAAGMLAVSCGGGSRVADVWLPEGAVPFSYDGHLLFKAVVCDSIPARLIFDTGATGLYLDTLWLAKSGYVPGRTVSALMPGGGGRAMSRVKVIRDSMSLQVDTIVWRTGGMVPVIDLKGILGRDADGIFGQKFLADQCVEFNMRRGYMRSVDADTLVAAGFIRCEVDKRNDRIYVPARVEFDSEHAVEGVFVLDMGCGGTVIVNSPAAKRAGFGSFGGRKVGYSTVSGGIGGDASSLFCRADSVLLGGFRFGEVPVEVSRNESGFLAREDVMGLIGNELLERFDFAVDFSAPALYLRPSEGHGEPFGFVKCGFSAIDRTDICDGWIVTGIYEGYCPQGLRQGDVVIEWDGIPLKGYAKTDSLMHAPGRHVFRILRGGETMEFETETKEIL